MCIVFTRPPPPPRQVSRREVKENRHRLVIARRSDSRNRTTAISWAPHNNARLLFWTWLSQCFLPRTDTECHSNAPLMFIISRQTDLFSSKLTMLFCYWRKRNVQLLDTLWEWNSLFYSRMQWVSSSQRYLDQVIKSADRVDSWPLERQSLTRGS